MSGWRNSGALSSQVGRRRQPPDDVLVAVVFGMERSVYVASHQGIVYRYLSDESLSLSERKEQRDMGRKAFSLAWSKRLYDHDSPEGFGLLVCALEGGIVEVVDAWNLKTLFTLEPGESSTRGPGPDVVGVSCSQDDECALWTFYANKYLTHWSMGEDDRVPVHKFNLKEPVMNFQGAHAVPTKPDLVVSHSSSQLHLWKRRIHEGGMHIEARAAPTGRSGELTALAVSPWMVACGYSSGEVHLMDVTQQFVKLEDVSAKHSADVLSLSFGQWLPGSARPLYLASVSRDRSAMVFGIDTPGQRGPCRATLLVKMPHYSALNHVALLTAPIGQAGSSEILRLGVCTSDQQLIIRELEQKTAQPRMTTRKTTRNQAPRSVRWVGLCAHSERGVFFAACSDRRLLQIDTTGRPAQQVRFTGLSSTELAAPMRLKDDGRLLAIGLVRPAGILLVDVENGMQPLARLSAGQAEPPSGVAILPGHCEMLFACWPDGTMMEWEIPTSEVAAVRRVPECQQPLQNKQQPTRSEALEVRRGRAASPRSPSPGRTRMSDTRGSVALAPATRGRFGSAARAESSSVQGRPVTVARQGSPERQATRSRCNRRSGSPPPRSSPMQTHRSVRGPPSPTTTQIHEAVRQKTRQALKEVDTNQAEVRGRKAQSPEASCGSKLMQKSDPACPGQENERMLERVFAQSPSPPRWADQSQLDADGNQRLPGATVPEPVDDIIQCGDVSASGRDLLGKWGRGSLVGDLVRSATDLHRNASSESLVAQAQIRSASEGAAVARATPIQRRLFPSPSNRPLLSKPPPPYPPPDTEATVEHTLDVTSISCASSIITTATSIPVAEPVVQEKPGSLQEWKPVLQGHEADHAATGSTSLIKSSGGLRSLATPCRARNVPPAPLSTQASADRAEGVDPFGQIERMIFEKFQTQSPQAASALQHLTKEYKVQLERILSQDSAPGLSSTTLRS